MKKIINFFKKHDNILIVIIILMCISFFISITKFVVTSDKIWNFANTYKISNGYKIYEDINIIITPLFFYIGEIFLKVLGKNLLIYEIYNIIISIGIFLTIYNIFKQVGINKKKSGIYMIFTIGYMYIIMIGANYNILALAFVLFGILEIIKDKRTRKNQVLQGIIIFLIFFSKQNIVIFYLLGLLTYKLYKNKNLKETIKELILPAIVSISLFFMFIIYMYINNNLYNFINYTILGIKEFGTNNISIIIIYKMLIYIFIIFIYFFIIKNKKIYKTNPKLKEKAILFLCFGFPLLGIAYPIFNEFHQRISSLVLIIGFIYILDSIFNGIISEKVQKIILTTILIGISIISLVSNLKYIRYILKSKYEIEYENPYYGALITKEDLGYINKVCEYIERNKKEENKNTIVFSNYANSFAIQTKKYNGDFDLPFLGNLGINGEDGLLEKLKNQKQTYILIINEEKEELFWQESKKINNYIKENYKYIGEIENFLIYETIN